MKIIYITVLWEDLAVSEHTLKQFARFKKGPKLLIKLLRRNVATTILRGEACEELATEKEECENFYNCFIQQAVIPQKAVWPLTLSLNKKALWQRKCPSSQAHTHSLKTRFKISIFGAECKHA